MDRNPPALARQAVLGQAGVVAPGPIDEIEGTVAPVAGGQRRDGVDGQLQLSFGLTNGLLGPPSFGILDLQRCVEFFELADRRLQVVARALERVCGAPLYRIQRHHKQSRDREQKEARQVLDRHRDRIHRGQEIIIESENGQRGREQARTDAAEPRREHDRAKKQRHERSAVEEPVQQQPADHRRDHRQRRHGVAQTGGRASPPGGRTGLRHFPPPPGTIPSPHRRQSASARQGSALDVRHAMRLRCRCYRPASRRAR